MEYLVVTLIILLVINLFNKQKRNTDIDEKLLTVRADMETWFASMTAYMKDIENHPHPNKHKDVAIKKAIDVLNSKDSNDRKVPQSVDFKKYGRNQVVEFEKNGETKKIKYKKSQPFLKDGWKIK